MNDSEKTREENEVREEPRVMSQDDVHDYQGLTLNEEGKEDKKEEEVSGSGFGDDTLLSHAACQ